MSNPFEEFKTAIQTALYDKVKERINNEGETVSNLLLTRKPINCKDNETAPKTEEN